MKISIVIEKASLAITNDAGDKVLFNAQVAHYRVDTDLTGLAQAGKQLVTDVKAALAAADGA